MVRNWYNRIPHPALKTKREITKYINWQQFTKGTRGKPIEQLFPRLQRHFFETRNKWMKWQDISVEIKALSPGGCLPKVRLQRDFSWNLQQMTEVTRCSCWHQNFVCKGLSAPAPGLYTCIKLWKKLYKMRLQRDFLTHLSRRHIGELIV